MALNPQPPLGTREEETRPVGPEIDSTRRLQTLNAGNPSPLSHNAPEPVPVIPNPGILTPPNLKAKPLNPKP